MEDLMLAIGGHRGSGAGASFEALLAGLLQQHQELRAEVERLRGENGRLRKVAASVVPSLRTGELPKKPPIPKLPACWSESSTVAPQASPNSTCSVSEEQSPARTRPPALADAAAADAAPTPGVDALPHAVPDGPEVGSRMSMDTVSRKKSTSQASIAFADESIFELEKRQVKAERRRLRDALGLVDDDVDVVTDKDLFNLLKDRIVDEELTIERVQRAMMVMDDREAADPSLAPATPWGKRMSKHSFVSFETLLRCVLDKKFPSGDEFCFDDLLVVMGGLRMLSVPDLVHQVTLGQSTTATVADLSRTSFESIFASVVMVTVVINFCSMGLELDHNPEHYMWFAIESCCVFIYLTEVFVKVRLLGLRGYLAGNGWHWNVCDLCITLVSAVDLAFQLMERLPNASFGGTKFSSVFQVAVLMRVLRIVRVVRMARLVRSPLFVDLANMLVGFVIGLPALIWVLAAFVFILFMVGLMFRICFGPVYGEEYMPACGWGDDLTDINGRECPIHYVYGEEFFGTVPKAMFTSFRFMLGDYSTRGGKSMVVALSAGYGWLFDSMFVGWMIVVIFGIFNIITSIFVDSTISGLKHNDVKRKHARQYERKYVQRKLESILERICALLSQRHERLELQQGAGGRGHRSSNGDLDARKLKSAWMKTWNMRTLEMDVEAFAEVMNDSVVKDLMLDIDIDFSNPCAMFDAFDANGNQSVTMEELAAACLKLRGEPQKHDIVCGAVAMKALHDKFDTLMMNLALQQAMKGAVNERTTMC